MSGERVRAVLRKELQELGQNKLILVAMAALPAIFVGLLLVINFATTSSAPGMVRGFRPPPELAAIAQGTALLVLLNDHFMFYLLFTPMLLPSMIAAHSVIGEKQARTLEPLLATPVRTVELLLAKTIAAVAPAVLIGWASYAVAAGGVLGISGPEVFRHFVRPLWLINLLVLSPLLALLATLLGVIISSRVSDARVAQGLSSIAVLPLLVGSIAALMSQAYLGLTLVLVAIAVVLPLDLGLLALAVAVFQREAILTRWK